MISPQTPNQNDDLFPDSLKELVRAYSSTRQLAVSLLPIPQEHNGLEHKYAAEWLTTTEREQLQHYTFTKRRLEWLSGRVCAKKAALSLLTGSGYDERLRGTDFSIVAGPSGRPFLNPSEFPATPDPIDISISHSHNRAIGLAGCGRCGIDIQYLSETLFKVKHRFCSDLEAVMLDQLPADELVQLGLLWVAKEAMRKCLSETRVVGFTELNLARTQFEDGYSILQFHPQIDGISFDQNDLVPVICHHSDQYTLGVAILNGESSHA